jgi:hypothetical protein
MVEDIKAGKPLVDQDELSKPMLKRLDETLLEGELNGNLRKTRMLEKHGRNGHIIKNLFSPLGGFDIFPSATTIPHSTPKLQRSSRIKSFMLLLTVSLCSLTRV